MTGLYAVTTGQGDSGPFVTVYRTTLDDESNERAFYSHARRGARLCVMANDARDARVVAGAYGMAADAGTASESFSVEWRGRCKSVPVISRRTMAEAGQ